MNTKIKTISMSFLLALSVGIFSLSASAQDKMGKMDGMKMGKEKMEMVVGKKGILNFRSSIRAGDTLLKSGTYQVQHIEEGGNHIIVLKEVPSGQGFRGGNTIPGKEVARLMCDYTPSAKQWKNTLRVFEQYVVFNADTAGDSRFWRYADIRDIGQLGRYRFEIATWEGEFGGDGKSYVFDLKRPMAEAEYETLWAKVYEQGRQTGLHPAIKHQQE